MIKFCDDCFDEFEATCDWNTLCKKCGKNQPQYFTNGDETGSIWQMVQTRGFRSQEEIDAYQIVKHDHKLLTGKDLPKVKEVISKEKGK